MATQFYARYVPPAAAGSDAPAQPPPPAAAAPSAFVEKLKRKRDHVEDRAAKKRKDDPEDQHQTAAEPKKSRKSKAKRGREEEGVTAEASSPERKPKKKEKREKKKKSEAAPPPPPDTDDGAPEQPREKSKKDRKEKKDKKRREQESPEDEESTAAYIEYAPTGAAEASIPEDTIAEQDTATGNAEERSKKKKEKKKSKKQKNEPAEKDAAVPPASADADSEPEVPSAHSSILQKLRKSLHRSSAVAASAPTAAAPEETHPDEAAAIAPSGLAPLPQPAPAAPAKPLSALSTLPPWLAHPITVSPATRTPFGGIPGLSPKLLQKLGAQSLTDAFAVQAAVLPLLLAAGPGDVCISAATGSGKTLAYVLPIIQALSSRVVTRLRAVIVVPTRELVSQVYATAHTLCAGTGLKIGTATGQRSFASEQAALVRPAAEAPAPADSRSRVDMLIATPGRLVEHVRATPGFSLQWAKWLVIDEADRLLAQRFQEWVDVVMGSVEAAAAAADEPPLAGLDLGVLGLGRRRRHVRKVVLSATMTRDVGKLAALKLRRPCLVVVEDAPPAAGAAGDVEMGAAAAAPEEQQLVEHFSIPPGLAEAVVPVEDAAYKPLVLLYLLDLHDVKTRTMVFVNNNEETAKLARLIEDVAGPARWRVGMVSGEMEKKRREKVLKRFARGDINLLVCSDLVARGMDLPNIDHVVNYDTAASTRAYVHRVGRTARAGRAGRAYTLLSGNEARWFWANVGGAGVRRTRPIEKVPVEMEPAGLGLRKRYEDVVFGA